LILTSLPAGCFDPVTQTLSGCFDPHGDLHSGCFETLLKILSEFKDTLLIENPPARPDTAGLTNAAAETFTDSAGGWNINRLAELVKSREKRQMLLQSASTRPFLSQLLAAAGDEAVDKPVNFALVLLAENPGGAAGSCSRLAELPPQRLFELIQASLARQNDELDGDWKSVFAGKPARVRLLAHLLGMGSNAYS